MVQGIKKNSPLNVIESFHVCNSGLLPCLAHDLFKGFIQKDLLYAIKYFISRQSFRIGFLNCRLSNLKLSTDSSSVNSIPTIKETYKKLCGTANQIRRSIHVLPVAIYNKIQNADDPVWQMIQCLNEKNYLSQVEASDASEYNSKNFSYEVNEVIKTLFRTGDLNKVRVSENVNSTVIH